MSARIASVERALQLLITLSSGGDLRITDLARSLETTKATASRLVATLERHGFVRRDAETGRIGLGATLAYLGLTFVERLEIRRFMQPFMRELFAHAQETVLLTVEYDGEVMCIDKLESDQHVRSHATIGERVPIYAGSASKAILSCYSDDEVRRKLSGMQLKRFTANTRCTMGALLEDLARTRERGYSMSVEEVNEGAAGVGAAVLDHSGRPVCAISVGGPKSRMSAERMAQLGEKVKAIAAKASAALLGAPAAEG